VPNLRSIAVEPVGATYVALIRFAEDQTSTFSLVWRHQLKFDPAAHEIREALRPSMIRQHVTDEWPGTQLLGHAAIVRFYRLSPAARGVLEAANGLYGWMAPGRPEDLAFYTTAGRCWLGSIAHEQDAFVDSDAVDVSRVVAAVPGLQIAD
jgi:hypothetical protein